MLLMERLQEQAIVRNDPSIADAIARNASLRDFRPGETLIRQDDPEPRLHFLIEGQVSIRVGGVEVAARKAGEQVGEMALVEPTRKGPTSVVATTPTRTAVIDEKTFRALAQQFPSLWRNIARILARRLREHGDELVTRREVPKVFIGSSPATFPVAHALREALAPLAQSLNATTWRDPASHRPNATWLESVAAGARQADFGVLVLGPEDLQGTSLDNPAARDHLLFRIGLFTGTLGPGRTILTAPVRTGLSLPADLDGFLASAYSICTEPGTTEVDVAHTVLLVQDLVRRLGPRQPDRL